MNTINLEYDQCQIEIIYVIDGSDIVSWYYHEELTSLTKEGSWTTEIFAKQYEDEITYIGEETLISLLNKRFN